MTPTPDIQVQITKPKPPAEPVRPTLYVAIGHMKDSWIATAHFSMDRAVFDNVIADWRTSSIVVTVPTDARAALIAAVREAEAAYFDHQHQESPHGEHGSWFARQCELVANVRTARTALNAKEQA